MSSKKRKSTSLCEDKQPSRLSVSNGKLKLEKVDKDNSTSKPKASIDFGPQVRHKKEYIVVPDTLRRSTPSEKEAGLWMNYSDSAFYPLLLRDERGEAMMVKESMMMRVELRAEGLVTEQLCPPTKSGVYWFKALKVYLAGQVRVEFTCPDLPLVTPRVLLIDVQDSADKAGTSRDKAVMASDGGRSVSACLPLPVSSEESRAVPAVLLEYLLLDSARVEAGRFRAVPCKSPELSVRQTLLAFVGDSKKNKTANTRCVESVLLVFEMVLETRLLTQEEKEHYSAALNQEEEETLRADSFGATFLLRLLFLLASARQSQGAEQEPMFLFCESLLEWMVDNTFPSLC